YRHQTDHGAAAGLGGGDQAAFDRLGPLVHGELHRIAPRGLAGERAGHSPQAAALRNEAEMGLVQAPPVPWPERAHFLSMAARLMRRVLVDAARSKGYQKRGAGAVRVTFDELAVTPTERGHDLVALDDALQALATEDQRKSQVIELRFFGGLSVK